MGELIERLKMSNEPEWSGFARFVVRKSPRSASGLRKYWSYESTNQSNASNGSPVPYGGNTSSDCDTKIRIPTAHHKRREPTPASVDRRHRYGVTPIQGWPIYTRATKDPTRHPLIHSEPIFLRNSSIHTQFVKLTRLS